MRKSKGLVPGRRASWRPSDGGYGNRGFAGAGGFLGLDVGLVLCATGVCRSCRAISSESTECSWNVRAWPWRNQHRAHGSRLASDYYFLRFQYMDGGLVIDRPSHLGMAICRLPVGEPAAPEAGQERARGIDFPERLTQLTEG